MGTYTTPKLILAAIVTFSLYFMFKPQMKTQGKMAKKKSMTAHHTGTKSQLGQCRRWEQRVGPTSEENGDRCHVNLTLALDPHAVKDLFGRDALSPKDDGGDDRDKHERHHGDPDGNLVPQLNDDAQQEQTKRRLGYAHANDGKCLTNHLVLDGHGSIVKGFFAGIQAGHRLAKAITSGNVNKDGIEQNQDLEK